MDGVHAKMQLAKQYYAAHEYRKALLELRHLTTSSAVSWNRRHRAGLVFSNAVRGITLQQEYKQSCEVLYQLARENSLPATL